MTDVLAATREGVAHAADLLRRGEVVAFPTDTVYGIGVSAAHPERLGALFELKQRPLDRRIPMLVAGLEDATAAGFRADDRARVLAAQFWPGALTLVLPGEETTQAFRAPDHRVALELIRASGPILATSANLSDQPDTHGADEVLIAFAMSGDGPAAVVDGGRVPGGVASTVLDLSVTPARVLREGPIDRHALGAVVDLAP